MCKKCPVAKGMGSADWTDPKLSVIGDRLRATEMLVRGKTKAFDSAVAHDVIKVPAACRAFNIEHLPEPGFRKTAWWVDVQDGNDIFAIIRANGKDNLRAGNDVDLHAVPALTDGTPISFLSVIGYEFRDPFSFRLGEAEIGDLDSFSPNSRDPKAVGMFMLERVRDLITNVTGIYGTDAELMHIAVVMTIMTSLWVKNKAGLVKRGWGDVAIVGDPGSGKSQALKLIREHFGIDSEAYHAATPDNWSPAGITIGMEQRSVSSKQWRGKPGLFPRSHGKCIMIDEFHSVTDSEAMKDTKGFMAQLQSARSEGKMSSAKMGAATLDAAVRLVTVSNITSESRDYRCREVMIRYKRPEQVRRLDSAVWVEVYNGPHETDSNPSHLWTSTRCERLMRRAWALKPDDIIVEAEAEAKIGEIVTEWNERFKHSISKIPLHSGPEKAESLRRMSVALANICFSHPGDDPHKCLVTEAHVLVAADWFEETWMNIDYAKFAEDCTRRAYLLDELECEKLLLQWGVPISSTPEPYDSNEILNVLDMISDPAGITFSRAQTIIGKIDGDLRAEALKWVKAGEIQNLWYKAESVRSDFGRFILTEAGRVLLERIRDWVPWEEHYAPRVRDLMLSNTESMMKMSEFDSVSRDLRK
jgi:hypothetical protein